MCAVHPWKLKLVLALVVEETVTGMTGEFVTSCDIHGDFAISFNRFSTWLPLIDGSELRLNSASTEATGFELWLVTALGLGLGRLKKKPPFF